MSAYIVGHTILKTEQVTTGLRQGDAMSSILFNLALEKSVRKATISKEDVRLEENNIEILAYADYIVILAESKDKFKKQVKSS